MSSCTGGLEGRALAGVYRDKAFEYRERAREKAEEASASIFEAVNGSSLKDLFEQRRDGALHSKKEDLGTLVLDLHGQTVAQAEVVLNEAIHLAYVFKVNKFVLITGMGNHSKKNQSKLMPAIRRLLTTGGYTFTQGDGNFVVRDLV